MSRIERATTQNADNNLVTAATEGAAEAVDFGGKSGVAIRSVTNTTITLFASNKIDGTYTKAKSTSGDITATLVSNEWVTLAPESAVYRFCKLVTASGTAQVEWIAFG